jgi:hypothetical protein
VSDVPEIFLDYKASVPSNMTGGVPAIALPGAPGVQLADLGIFIPPPVPMPNRVELKGTLGIQALTGTPLAVFRIFRLANGIGPGVQIFNKEQTLEPAPAEAFYTLSFLMIDFNVSASTGFIVYRLTGELSNPIGNTANVVGPVTFTGLAVGNLD